MIKRLIIALLFFGMLLGIWHLSATSGLIPKLLLPTPVDVLNYLISSIKDGTLWQATLVTFERLIIGYAVSLVLALPLGLLCGRIQAFRDTIGLLALGVQTLPSVCWVPLALLWFGQSESAMLFVVVMGSLWSILLATEHGVRTVPPIYLKAARSLGSRGLHMILAVQLPAALPAIVSGMKQGWAFAWRSLMAAEIYVTVLTGFGLGHLLHYGRELHALEQVFGVMFVIIASGYLVDRAIFGPLERTLRHRWGLN